MSCKEYLSRAYYINRRINTSMDRVESLYEMLREIPNPLSSSGYPMQPASILKEINQLDVEIHDDIDLLIDVKKDIAHVIKRLVDVDQQIVLELRYLCFKSWNFISDGFRYSRKRVLRIHSDALQNLLL
ncbi:hypothetical protein FACS18948_4480 [Clostridia bacterium]|nr:hypothetical protein FACS18948_4480 [Clostridia bacterium]